MTEEEFKKIIPGKSIIKAKVEDSEEEKNLLVKFFVCDYEGFDGYWMCCTEDFNNPHPHETMKEDYYVYYNECELIKL